MGLIHVMLAKLKGARNIIVSDLLDRRLKIAKKLGATHVISSKKSNFVQQVRKTTQYKGVNKAFLTVGATGIVEKLLEVVLLKGRVSIFADGPKGFSSNINLNLIHYNEITINGIQNAIFSQFKKGLKLVASGNLNVKRLITHKFPLQKAIEAFSLRDKLRALKVTLVP